MSCDIELSFMKNRTCKNAMQSQFLTDAHTVNRINTFSTFRDWPTINLTIVYICNKKLLLGFQSGFRSLCSTLTALLVATHIWSVTIDKGLLKALSLLTLLRHSTPLMMRKNLSTTKKAISSILTFPHKLNIYKTYKNKLTRLLRIAKKK